MAEKPISVSSVDDLNTIMATAAISRATVEFGPAFVLLVVQQTCEYIVAEHPDNEKIRKSFTTFAELCGHTHEDIHEIMAADHDG